MSVIIVGWGTGGASPHGLVIESASLAAGDDGADLRGEPRRCRAEPAGALARDRPARRRRNAGTPLARAVAVKLSLTAGYAVDARVEAGGNERAPQDARADLLGQSGPAGDLPDDPPTPCLSSRCTVRVMKIGPSQRLAMARSGAGAVARGITARLPPGDRQGRDVVASGPVAWECPAADDTADTHRRGLPQRLLFDGVLIEPGDVALPLGDGGPGAPGGFEAA